MRPPVNPQKIKNKDALNSFAQCSGTPNIIAHTQIEEDDSNIGYCAFKISVCPSRRHATRQRSPEI